MPGDPTAFLTHTYAGSSGSTPPSSAAASPGHWGFIFWLVLIGVVIPAAILGGFKVAGYSFVFRHR